MLLVGVGTLLVLLPSTCCAVPLSLCRALLLAEQHARGNTQWFTAQQKVWRPIFPGESSENGPKKTL